VPIVGIGGSRSRSRVTVETAGTRIGEAVSETMLPKLTVPPLIRSPHQPLIGAAFPASAVALNQTLPGPNLSVAAGGAPTGTST